jgi:hypothetical protein
MIEGIVIDSDGFTFAGFSDNKYLRMTNHNNLALIQYLFRII